MNIKSVYIIKVIKLKIIEYKLSNRMERKKQIKFVDEMGNDSQDNMIYQSQMQDSALKPQHSSSMLDSQQVSPLKRKKSILVNRPSSPTEYEAMEQEMTVITRDNYVKHAEVDANKLEC